MIYRATPPHHDPASAFHHNGQWVDTFVRLQTVLEHTCLEINRDECALADAFPMIDEVQQDAPFNNYFGNTVPQKRAFLQQTLPIVQEWLTALKHQFQPEVVLFCGNEAGQIGRWLAGHAQPGVQRFSKKPFARALNFPPSPGDVNPEQHHMGEWEDTPICIVPHTSPQTALTNEALVDWFQAALGHL